MNNLFTRFKKIETISSVVLFFIPLILILSTGEVRESISDYAYSEHPHILPILLSLSASLFIYNGVINKYKWYNIVLGSLLLGIAFTPHLDYKITHYIFAILFFLANALVMVFYSSKKQRLIKIIAASIIILSVFASFVLNLFSIFIAEWIAIIPISIHFLGESLGKLD